MSSNDQDDHLGTDHAANAVVRCNNHPQYAERGIERWQAYAAQMVKTYVMPQSRRLNQAW